MGPVQEGLPPHLARYLDPRRRTNETGQIGHEQRSNARRLHRQFQRVYCRIAVGNKSSRNSQSIQTRNERLAAQENIWTDPLSSRERPCSMAGCGKKGNVKSTPHQTRSRIQLWQRNSV